jgi:hypothetical protein
MICRERPGYRITMISPGRLVPESPVHPPRKPLKTDNVGEGIFSLHTATAHDFHRGCHVEFVLSDSHLLPLPLGACFVFVSLWCSRPLKPVK